MDESSCKIMEDRITAELDPDHSVFTGRCIKKSVAVSCLTLLDMFFWIINRRRKRIFKKTSVLDFLKK